MPVRRYFKRKNSSGGYDIVYLYTDANAVAETDARKFVSSTEKTTWNNKLSGVQLNGTDLSWRC